MATEHDRKAIYEPYHIDLSASPASDLLNALYSLVRPYPLEVHMEELDYVLDNHVSEINLDDYVPRFLKVFALGVVKADNQTSREACFKAFCRLQAKYSVMKGNVLHDGAIGVAKEMTALALISWAYPIKVKSEQVFAHDQLGSMEYYQFAIDVITNCKSLIPMGFYHLYPLIFDGN